MKLTIAIKALNEERHIENAIVSALKAAKPYAAEVIVADSLSNDKTLEIARHYPIKIVQLDRAEDRSCGAAAQLAFQHSTGEYFYLIDGDMIIREGFLERAIELLEQDSTVAGVGGFIEERELANEEFEIRAAALKRDADKQAGFVDRLDGGGVYRSEAIRDVHYFSDRNLHAFEELELGVRLRAKSWKLIRIPVTSADHFGHRASGYRLMARRFKSGYFRGIGEVMKSALGQSHFYTLMCSFNHIYYFFTVLGWWISLIFAPFSPLKYSTKMATIAILLAAPIIILVWRRRSLSLGIYSFTTWNLQTIAAVMGLFGRRVRPTTPLPSKVVQ